MAQEYGQLVQDEWVSFPGGELEGKRPKVLCAACREALNREESDRTVRLARLAALAEQVFGEPERAWRWLRASKRQFDGRSPLQFMSTEAGARLIEELLHRIDEGMAA